MICPNPDCKRIVSPYDEKCQHCGTNLKSHPVKDYMKKADKTIEDAEAISDDILASIRSEFKDRRASQYRQMSNSKLSTSQSILEKATEREMHKTSGVEQILHKILNKGQKNSKIKELFGIVQYNPHVTENPAFYSLASKVIIIYDDEEMGVNAFAAVIKDRPVIVIFDGYLNFMVAVDAIFKVKKFEKLVDLGERLLSRKYEFSLYDLACVIDDLPNEAKNIENPYLAVFETIAHELGHICYNHVFSPGYSNMTEDESRNMERDADSFAASVINRSIFNKDFLISHLKCCLAWAIVEKVGSRVEPGTHPLAFERLLNAIKSNAALAKELGIDEELVQRLIV
jgi:hypothetical protein